MVSVAFSFVGLKNFDSIIWGKHCSFPKLYTGGPRLSGSQLLWICNTAINKIFHIHGSNSSTIRISFLGIVSTKFIGISIIGELFLDLLNNRGPPVVLFSDFNLLCDGSMVEVCWFCVWVERANKFEVSSSLVDHQCNITKSFSISISHFLHHPRDEASWVGAQSS